MSKKDKRLKRSKLKAKQANIIKHREKFQSRNNNLSIARITPRLIAFFKTLPELTPDLECVPLIYNYYVTSGGVDGGSSLDDLSFQVAYIFVMYGHWFTSDSNVIDLTELMIHADLFTENETFIKQLNYAQMCL